MQTNQDDSCLEPVFAKVLALLAKEGVTYEDGRKIAQALYTRLEKSALSAKVVVQ